MDVCFQNNWKRFSNQRKLKKRAAVLALWPMAFEYQMALLPPLWEKEHGRPPPWKFRGVVGFTRTRMSAMPWETDATCKISLDYSPPCLYKVDEVLPSVWTAAGPRESGRGGSAGAEH